MATKRRKDTTASETVGDDIRRMKRGTLRRGPKGHGGKVTDRKQAIAIGLNEARREGADVPPPPKRGAKKKRGGAARRGVKRANKRAGARGTARKSVSKGARKTANRARKTPVRGRK